MTEVMNGKYTISAVLWDFGGVFTTSPFEAFNHYVIAHDLPENFIRQLNSKNSDSNAWAQLERNEVSLSQFCKAFEEEARNSGGHLDGAEVLNCIHGQLREEMVGALRSISRQYKTACLTNNFSQGANSTNSDTTATKEVMEMFDIIVESSKVGCRKPELAFYQTACDMLEVSPNEAIFLDDLGVNLKPAKTMGMQTIKVVTPTQALEELETCLGHDIS